MWIIEIKEQENGSHRNQWVSEFVEENYKENEWAYIPDDMELPKNFPFVNIQVQGNKVIKIEDGILPEVDLNKIKQNKILQSKQDLASYLEKHPLQWTDGEYYSITFEKQQQLTSKILSATMAQMLSQDYTLTWNSTGEVCKEWSLEELQKLAFAIDSRVTKLVTYQQQKEIEIKNASSQEDLNKIIINYDEVQ